MAYGLLLNNSSAVYLEEINSLKVTMARKLDRLGIDAEIVERLAKHNINTVHDYYRISMSPLLLMNYTNLPLIDLKRLSTLISNKTHVKPSTALEILHSRSQMKRFLSTGIESFDRNMRGGLLVGCINEIVGAPGRSVGVCAGACLTNSTASYTIAISMWLLSFFLCRDWKDSVLSQLCIASYFVR